ncbi:MAG TPA: hypothetical protein VFO10_30970 [Oligoflexus sp.]|nr:hypothetical protein [Oligoflexus sp.]HET9241731.1 hypothetical protein [Oligoflexus sp.]
MKSQRLWIVAFGFWYWFWPAADLDDGTLPLPLEFAAVRVIVT